MDIIRVHDLSFRYSNSNKYALKNVSFSIHKGDFIVLAGPSGGGKTTLARALIGLVPQFYDGDYSGRVEVLGMDPFKTPISTIANKVGFLFQNPDNQIFMTTVERDIAFGLEFRNFDPVEIMDRIRWAMDIMSIGDLADKRIEELSGGEKQKVALCGLLALKPEILILDEPTAYLAPKSARDLIYLLEDFNRTYKITIVLIDHRLDLAFEVAKRLLVIKEGKLELDIPISRVFKYNLSKEFGINVPSLLKLSYRLRKKGLNIEPNPPTVDNFLKQLLGDIDI